MKTLISNIPILVRQYRHENKLTQAQLAEQIRVALAENGIEDSKFDHTFISRIENNKDASRIDLGTLSKLRLVIEDIEVGNIAIEIDD